MAEERLQFIIDATNRSDAAFKDVNKGIEGVKGKLKSMQPAFKKMAAVGTVAFGAISAAIVKSGLDIENATSIIVKGTGATGKSLKEMTNIARKVGTKVPQNLESVATATAEVSTRFEVTGEELEDLTKLSLDFARVTGMETQPAIRQVSRIMGDWGIETKEAESLMDQLVTVSQLSGVEIGKLSETMVNYGVQLRALGFSQRDAVAMLGKFEKEGVATEKIFAGLSMALGRLAQEGVDDTAEAFDMLSGKISVAGSTGDAVREAIEILGTRAGPDFALAVKEGRFELDDWTEALDNTQGKLRETADASMNAMDQLKVLKNSVLNAIAPTEEMREKLAGVVNQITDWVRENPGWTKGIVVVTGAIAGLVAVIGLLGIALPGIITMVTALAGVTLASVAAFAVAVSWIVLIGVVIGELIAIGWMLYRDWDMIWEGVGMYILEFEELIKSIFIRIDEAIRKFLIGIEKEFKELFGAISEDWNGLWDRAYDHLTNVWEGIKEVVGDAIGWLMDKIQPFIDAFERVKSGASWLGSKAGGAASWVKEKLSGSKQFGGEIPRTGKYLLHKGEEVVPAGSATRGGITVNITGGYFLSEDVAEELGDKIIEKIKRVTKL